MICHWLITGFISQIKIKSTLWPDCCPLIEELISRIARELSSGTLTVADLCSFCIDQQINTCYSCKKQRQIFTTQLSQTFESLSNSFPNLFLLDFLLPDEPWAKMQTIKTITNLFAINNIFIFLLSAIKWWQVKLENNNNFTHAL